MADELRAFMDRAKQGAPPPHQPQFDSNRNNSNYNNNNNSNNNTDTRPLQYDRDTFARRQQQQQQQQQQDDVLLDDNTMSEGSGSYGYGASGGYGASQGSKQISSSLPTWDSPTTEDEHGVFGGRNDRDEGAGQYDGRRSDGRLGMARGYGGARNDDDYGGADYDGGYGGDNYMQQPPPRSYDDLRSAHRREMQPAPETRGREDTWAARQRQQHRDAMIQRQQHQHHDQGGARYS